MEQKQYMAEIIKRSNGNQITCDRCHKTQTTLHHVMVDHKEKTVTVLCNECFLKREAQDARKDN